MARENPFISINFTDLSVAEAKVSVLDHAFLFGDSVYEVIRTWNGKLLFAQEHFERLHHSADGIHMSLPYSDQEYRKELERLHKRSGFEESSLRLIVTRGIGRAELSPLSCHSQSSIAIAQPLSLWPQELYEQGGRLSLYRKPTSWSSPGLKTGRALSHVLASRQAREEGAVDAILFDQQDYVRECTTSNFFMVKEDKVFTPELDIGVLAGITRAKVLLLCERLNIPYEEGRYKIETFLDADELFITSSSRNVMPITWIEDQSIGSAEPGPVTRTLMKAYEELSEASLAKDV